MNTESGPSRQVDYDEIASSYDQRFEANDLRSVATALQTVAQEVKARRILEIGCGTGRWLMDLGAEDRHLWGLDLSSGMLGKARQRDDDLRLVQGRGERPPFRGEVFDLVFCVNAIHHFDAPQAFVGEAHRLLRSGGTLAVIGSDPRGRQEDWYVYDFFEGTYETDLRRFPSWDTTMEWMTMRGFAGVERRTVARVVDHKTGRGVLEDPFLRKHACSQLALLTEEAYVVGVRRIKAALARAEAAGETLVFPTHIELGMILGRKDGEQ